MPAWGYIQQSSKLKDLLARWLGYPHPLGRVAANIVCRYANFKSLRTLDIGCDAGVYSFEFLNRGVKEIISMDIESQALQAARENILRFDCPALPVQADAQNIPFRENSFDQVLCLMVLEHVTDPLLSTLLIRSCCYRKLAECWNQAEGSFFPFRMNGILQNLSSLTTFLKFCDLSEMNTPGSI
jgi:2-polyprenyl-3-methyl-5-hydroxy-6-metoxy-1,4-benzoquinol methylase